MENSQKIPLLNWRKVLIPPSTKILEAIKIIDEGSLQIALVVDDHNRLLGTITDGDIRRGILNNITLDSPAQRIMNPRPVFARINDAQENILALMKSKELHQIPILDENNCVAGLEILDELIQLVKRENVAVLMVGGIGSRLRPLTDECPKPLLKVGSKPILETILDNLIEAGFHRFYFSVNFKAEMLRNYFHDGSRWGVEINYLYEDKALGTAGSLSLLPYRPSIPFLVMNGDLLTKVNFNQLLKFHQEHKAEATMCVREYTFQVPYGVAKIENHRLVDIAEKPIQQHFVSAGIYVLEPEILDFIPSGAYLDMPELFQFLLAEKKHVATFPIREYWLDIGRMDDLERAKFDFTEIFE